MFKRDHYRCQVCGESREHRLQVHHWREYRSAGGAHSVENLVTVCGGPGGGCHDRLHAHEIEIAVLEWAPGCWAAFVKR